MRGERVFAAIAIRCVALAGAVLLASVPVYVFVEAPWRPVVVRLAAALVLAVALLQLRGAVAGRLARTSALDEARARPEAPPSVPLRFLELIEDLRAARRSRRHFERSLWPRLTALASRPLVPPRVRPGRGPSLAALRELIARIERSR